MSSVVTVAAQASACRNGFQLDVAFPSKPFGGSICEEAGSHIRIEGERRVGGLRGSVDIVM